MSILGVVLIVLSSFVLCTSYVIICPTTSNSASMSQDNQSNSGEGRSPQQPSRKRTSLPRAATDHYKEWLVLNKYHPYPSESLKNEFATSYGLTHIQVNNWFINNRRRYFIKVFPDHDKHRIYTPKRGAGRSVRRPRVNEEENRDSSLNGRPSARRRVTVSSPSVDSSPVESNDSNSSSACDSSSSMANQEICNHHHANLLLLSEVCCARIEQERSHSEMRFC